MNNDVKHSMFGNELMMLYSRVNLSQSEFAHLVGISSVALRKWESGASCPKAESLKSALEILISKGAFSEGEEQTEARHLWKLANERGLKVPFDEVWFRGVITSPPTPETVGIVPGAGPTPTSADSAPTSPAGEAVGIVLGADPVRGADPGKTRRQGKRLLPILIALAILTIIGSAGTLLFQAIDHTITQANEAASGHARKTSIAQYPGYLSGSGILAFFDPLSQQNGSQWGTFRGACQFTGGAYHIRKLSSGNFNRWCAPHRTFGNFALEVQLTIMQGDCGGIAFRDDHAGDFYYFPVCQDGTYAVCTYPSNSGCTSPDRHSPAIKTGLGQQNKIAVVANGGTMKFYVNERQIDQLQDGSYTSGYIELVAAPFYPNGHVTDVAYTNARLWTL